ncbi:MAG: 50S ribosomal protein L22 [Candidatus Omnitrophica bacterium]|nr:50S ribosomal protein L22 [Candidatus Omnitrophota bacterium]
MIARAEGKFIRISPTKVRPVITLIKGSNVTRAMNVLDLTNKKGALLLNKVLKSAVSNAKNKGYGEDKLFVSKVVANLGPAFKRHQAASFGRASVIKKKTSHILIELDTTEKLITKVKVK